VPADLIAAPGRANVVFVRPRWVAIAERRITIVHIGGDNLMR
jgi:hypothetical protein